MKLRPFRIQEHRNTWMPHFDVPRVDYHELLNTLRFPLIWTFDRFLDAWLPSEVDYEFLDYLQTVPFPDFNPDELPKGRWTQLQRAGLIEPERSTLDELRTLMKTYGHVKLVNLLPPEYCKHMLKQYYWRNDHKHDRWKDLEGIKRTSCNNMPLMRLIHQATERMVNWILDGETIKTSYSFTSAYEPGTNLPAHTDRPQCVWNISLMLGADPPDVSLSNWPIFIQKDGHAHRVNLEVGDGVLYSGVRDLHWRDVMPAEIASTLGVFFHYVPHDFEGQLD